VLKIVTSSPGRGTFRCDDAAVYLLERLGDIAGGQKIVLGVVREGLAVLSGRLSKSVGPAAGGDRTDVHLFPEAQAIRDCLKTAFELNFRNAQLLEGAEREELWFEILAMFVNPAHDAMLASNLVKGSKKAYILLSMQAFLSTLTRDTIMAMSDAMPLTKVAARLVQEHSGSTLASFREILSDLLESCGHEVDVLATAKRVIDTDLMTARQQVIAQRRQRIATHALKIDRSGAAGSGKAFAGGQTFTSWLNNNASSHLGVFSSSSNENAIQLHLAPPPGAECIAHGNAPNICAPTRGGGGFFPQEAKFRGHLM